jgi:hypothetical protein
MQEVRVTVLVFGLDGNSKLDGWDIDFGACVEYFFLAELPALKVLHYCAFG